MANIKISELPAVTSISKGDVVAVVQSGTTKKADFDFFLPAGIIVPFAGNTSPNGWLLCYGQAVSRSGYSALFNAIGTSHGVGDGSTTFNLPDLRGRTIAGLDNMGGSAASRITSAISGITATTLGAAGGDQRVHQHTHAQNAHSHGVTDPGHAHGVYDPSHAHTQRQARTTVSDGPNGGLGYNHFGGVGDSNLVTANSGTGIGIYGAGTSVSVNSGTATNQDFGSGSAQNIPPTIILNYIIRV